MQPVVQVEENLMHQQKTIDVNADFDALEKKRIMSLTKEHNEE
jgi:hypothetical protein